MTCALYPSMTNATKFWNEKPTDEEIQAAVPKGYVFVSARHFVYKNRNRVDIRIRKPRGKKTFMVVLYETGGVSRPCDADL